MMSLLDHDLTASERARLAKWYAHVAQSGGGAPDKECFKTFGSLSSLDRLHRVLSRVEPDSCGQLRIAMTELRKLATRNTRKRTGGQRGPIRQYSVLRDELPHDWIVLLDSMATKRAHLDAGGLHLSGPKPPSAASLKDMTYVLRALARSCQMHGLHMVLNKTTVRAWLDDAEARGCGAQGLAFQLGMLQRFARRLLGKKQKMTKALAEMQALYRARGRGDVKRKEIFLLNNPKSLGGLWQQAEDLLHAAHRETPGTAARYKLMREACALALAIVAPLRVGDLHRLIVGKDIERVGGHWRLNIKTKKTGGNYDRGALWPELTPFLDALICDDAPGADIWSGYELRIGTPLFALEGGKVGLSGDWISSVWRKHVGSGAHIVRTLWHQTIWECDRDGVWIALALCGQDDVRTATAYRVEDAKRRSVREGRRLLSAARADRKTATQDNH